MTVLASGMTRSQAELGRGLPSERALENPRRRGWRTTSLQARFGGCKGLLCNADSSNGAATVVKGSRRWEADEAADRVGRGWYVGRVGGTP